MEKELLYLELIKTYKEKQLFVAIEELSELQKEICKALRGKENKTAIIEEIADVEIILEQIKIYFDIEQKDIDNQMNIKLARTKERYYNG